DRTGARPHRSRCRLLFDPGARGGTTSRRRDLAASPRVSGHRRGETPPGEKPPPAEYEFVDDPAGIRSVTEALRSATGPVAVDVERASGIRYSERAFLLQLRA